MFHTYILIHNRILYKITFKKIYSKTITFYDLRRVASENSDSTEASASLPSFEAIVSKPMSALDFLAKEFPELLAVAAFFSSSTAHKGDESH